MKAWQLFVLLIVVPFVLYSGLMVYVFTGNHFDSLFRLFAMIIFLFTGLLFGWIYVLGINLFKKMPSSLSSGLTKFRIAICIPAMYILLISIFMSLTLPTANPPQLSILALIIPLHLISMACILYCLYFVAKALKTAEWQQPVSFSDYLGEFFLLGFFPVGVWLIQPRINKLFSQTTENE